MQRPQSPVISALPPIPSKTKFLCRHQICFGAPLKSAILQQVEEIVRRSGARAAAVKLQSTCTACLQRM